MRNALEFDTLEKSFALQFGEAVELVEHPIPDGDGITYPTAEEKEVKTNSRYYSEIARAIQEKRKTNVPFLPCDMPAGVVGVYAEGEKVGYNAGHSSGYEEGKAAGYEAGREAEYDAFWDVYQQNGNRTNYENAFSGSGWNVDNFNPKYDMKPTVGSSIFYRFDYDRYGSRTLDLVERFNECGVELDFSNVTGLSYGFQNARISHIGVVDATSCSTLTGAFINCYWLAKIDKLVVKDSLTFSNTFNNCDALKEIIIEGVIGESISFYVSPLTKESIISVINALSSTTSGKTATFKKSAKEAAFIADEWAELIATKTNWTFSLV